MLLIHAALPMAVAITCLLAGSFYLRRTLIAQLE
jgi:hypothetical protein